MERFVMALDQGTTSSRCLLFDHSGAVRALEKREFAQHYPKPGWVEHDANEILGTQLDAARAAMASLGARPEQIAAIGVANQRETVVLWDARTGEPVAPAIVWQCRRTAEACARLENTPVAKRVREMTGLRLDPYFSATKLEWLLDSLPGARERAARGELRFGTVDSWLLWKLTGGRVHATDASNASRTMLYDIRALRWDEELCHAFRVPMAMLPEVRPSSGDFGETTAFGGRVPIRGVAGDQQAALFGQGCLSRGDAKNTYGTGCFLLMNTGDRPVVSRNNLLSTVAWQLNGRTTYALEGSVFVAGAAIQWLRDELGLLSSAAESEMLARSVPDTCGAYLVPAFTGLGAPYWDADARGALVGLTRGVNRAHIARAALESMAYQVLDVYRAMAEDADVSAQTLRVDGGASVNGFLMQFQADMLGASVCRPASVETTALGAAALAGIGVGFWSSLDELAALQAPPAVFTPRMSESERRAHQAGWHEAVRRVRGR